MQKILTLSAILIWLVPGVLLAQKSSALSLQKITIKAKGSEQPLPGIRISYESDSATTNKFGEAWLRVPITPFKLKIILPKHRQIQQEPIVVPVTFLCSGKILVHLDNAISMNSTLDTELTYKHTTYKKSKASSVHSVALRKCTMATSEFAASTTRGESVTDDDALAKNLERYDAAYSAKSAAGTLTTGEVNDFTKWKMWNEICAEKLLEQTTHKLYFNKRYTVQLMNQNNAAICNAQVTLYKNNEVEWRAVTDNTGKAELWGNILTTSDEATRFVEVVYNEQRYNLGAAKPFEEGLMQYTITSTCMQSNIVDIAFVVDATGSMGDEIQYLQTELQDVISRTQNINKTLQFHMASVFYRDINDTYVTTASNFSANINTTLDFIKKQSAGGGGDFPEAVDEALEVAINELCWHSDARTKILFLVLDAPPHNDTATMNRYYALLQLAAVKGIRIVPLAGSGINKATEFLMRCSALATNGTYCFLTNHSGIGNTHIEPTTNDYKVEKMNDLLIRILTQFTFMPLCPIEEVVQNTDTSKINNDNPFNEASVTTKFKIYPNPSTGIVYVDVPEAEELIINVTDISGKLIRRIITQGGNHVEVDLRNVPSGIYFIRFLHNNNWVTGKVLIGSA